MKKLLAIALVLALTLSLSAAALADDLITVNGMATVSVPADMATVMLGVTTLDKDVQKTAALNAERIEAVVFALKELGIPEADITTNNYYMDTMYDYNVTDENGYAIRGYQVSNTINVTVRNLDLVGQVVDTALRAGANQVNSVAFQSTKSGEACDEALRQAIAEARRKAELAAAAGGVKLGKLANITENYGSYNGVMMKTVGAAAEDRGVANTRFMASGLDCSATVTVSFEIDE